MTPISIAPGPSSSLGKRRSKTAAAVRASYGVKTNRADVCLSIYLSGLSAWLGMELCGCAEAIVMQVHRLLAKVALVPVRPVVAAHAREAVAGVETLELLRAYLVYVDLAEVDV